MILRVGLTTADGSGPACVFLQRDGEPQKQCIMLADHRDQRVLDVLPLAAVGDSIPSLQRGAAAAVAALVSGG